MPFVPLEDGIRVFWEHEFFTVPGKGWVSTFEQVDGPRDNVALTELAAELVAFWNTSLKSLMTPDSRLTRLRLRRLDTQTSPVMEYTTGLPILGTRTGAGMPANVAFSLKLSSGFAGRSHRGRLYWFGFNEADVVGNFLVEAYANAARDAWQSLTPLIETTSASFQWGVGSFWSGGQPRTTGVFTPFSTVSYVDRRVDSQRRRLPKD